MIAKDLLPLTLATVLICQLCPVGAIFSNITVTVAATDSNTGVRATHAVTVAGAIENCVGPTPPTGLSFPTNTWMEVLAIASGPITTKYNRERGGGDVTFTATGPTTLWTTYSWADYPQLQPYTDLPSCCGQCTVYFSRVEVNYWPVPGANTACLNSGVGSNNLASSLATVPPSNHSVTTTVGPDGFTYTSPSVYLAYHDISASNRCGQVGPKHTSVTVAVDPGQLSTLFANGTGYDGPGGQIATFDLKQLPCPPQSLIDAQRSAVWPGFKFHLEQNEWAPIIEPPPYIRSLEPAWASCISEYVLDPPRTLVPATAMVPSPTPSNDPKSQTTRATPSATIPTPPLQISITASSFNPDPLRTPVDPGTPGDPAATENWSPPADSNNFPKVGGPKSSNVPGSSLDPGASIESKASLTISSIGVPSNVNQQAPANSVSRFYVDTPQGPAFPVIIVGSQTLPSLPNGDFAIGDSTLKAYSSAITFHGVPTSLDDVALAVGSSTIHLYSGNVNGALTAAGLESTSLDASIIDVASNTLSINGPKGTPSGTVISLVSAGLVLGTKTFAMPSPSPIPDATLITTKGVFTLTAQTFTPEGKSDVASAGNTLSVNGPDTTISGAVISGAPSGQVVAGQTLTLPTPSPGAMGNIVIIAGSTLTAGGPPVTIGGTPLSLAIGPSGLYVSGQGSGTLSQSALVVAGASVSLDPAGQLIVGSSTVAPATGNGDGGLGSVIMAGFGPASSTAGPSLGSGNATAGTLAFTGGAGRLVGLGMMSMVVQVSVVGWLEL